MAKAKSKSKSKAKVKAKTKVKAKPKAKTKAKVKKSTAKKAAVKKKTSARKPSTKKKAQVTAKTSKKTATRVKNKTKTKAKTKVKPKSKPKVKAKAKPKVKASSPKKIAKTKATTRKVSSPKKAVSKKVATKEAKARKTRKATKVEPVASSISQAKPLSRDFMVGLAEAIRAAVAPAIRSFKGRQVVGSATSGDVTFELDKIAERALMMYLKSAREPVAYYSEDTGYATFTNSQPENLLVVDPIDGTRAAKSGFEGCVVSVASTRIIERPRMADVESACIIEILGNRTFYAERGKGARIYVDNAAKKPKLSPNSDLETVAWSMTVPARPAELIFPTAARLIDLTSLKGGFFACNSTAYSLTRLLTNQLDACVDFANRYYRDIREAVEDKFINAGRGIVLGIAPYDMAAAVLIAQEAGCTVTDAYGKSFDDVLLLDSGVANQRSMIASSNAVLHKKLLKFFDTRIKQFESLLAGR